VVVPLRNDPNSSEFEQALRSRQDKLRTELRRVRTQLERMRIEEQELGEQLHHIEALLGEGASEPSEQRETETASVARDASVADLVVALLQEVGRPLHYREIEQELRARGQVEMGGQDPANALLARYFKDDRLYRPARGTYAIRSG